MANYLPHLFAHLLPFSSSFPICCDCHYCYDCGATIAALLLNCSAAPVDGFLGTFNPFLLNPRPVRTFRPRPTTSEPTPLLQLFLPRSSPPPPLHLTSTRVLRRFTIHTSLPKTASLLHLRQSSPPLSSLSIISCHKVGRACFPVYAWVVRLSLLRQLRSPQLMSSRSTEVIREKVQDGLTGEAKEISYTQCKIVGNGSFGVVFQTKMAPSGEDAAIKRVLQDKRFKVRQADASGIRSGQVLIIHLCRIVNFRSCGSCATQILSSSRPSTIPMATG